MTKVNPQFIKKIFFILCAGVLCFSAFVARAQETDETFIGNAKDAEIISTAKTPMHKRRKARSFKLDKSFDQSIEQRAHLPLRLHDKDMAGDEDDFYRRDDPFGDESQESEPYSKGNEEPWDIPETIY